jgi:hypothetical protein
VRRNVTEEALTIPIEDTAIMTLTEKDNVLVKNAIAEQPAPPSTDSLKLQEVVSVADRDPGMKRIRLNAGQLRLNPMGPTEVDGMLQPESPMGDNFWYSFLDPLPVDVDFGSA